MSWCVCPWNYPVWDSLCFLDLINSFLSHIGEVFNYNLFKYFLSPFLFLFLFWDHYNLNLVSLMLSQRSLRLSSILFILFCLFRPSANGWGCVPVLLVVWHRVSSTVACWSLSGAGSWRWDGDLWEIFTFCYYMELGGLLWTSAWTWLSHLRCTALTPGWSTKSLSSTWLRIKGRKKKKERKKKIKSNQIRESYKNKK